jgi:hypothetical protein
MQGEGDFDTAIGMKRRKLKSLNDNFPASLIE